MKKPNKTQLKFLIKLIVTTSLIGFLISKINIETLPKLDWSLSAFLILCLIITLIAIFLMSVRWYGFCVYFLNIRPKISTLYSYYLIGNFFNIFLPGAIGGDVVRTQKLISNFKVKIKQASLITIAERVLGLYGLLILLNVGLLLKNYPLQLEFISKIPFVIYILSFLCLVAFIPVSKFILKRKNVEVSYKFITETILILLLAQFGDIIIAYILSNHLGATLPFSTFVFIMPLVYLATVLPISLGGLGVREGTFAGLMLLYGVPTSLSIIISFTMYLIKVVVGMLGGIIYLKVK